MLYKYVTFKSSPMSTVKLRKVGGSTMLTIAPAILAALPFSSNSSLKLTVSNGELTVRDARPRYKLDDLLEGFVPDLEADKEWLDMPSIDAEL